MIPNGLFSGIKVSVNGGERTFRRVNMHAAKAAEGGWDG